MVRQEMAPHKETQSYLVFFTPTELKLCTMKKTMLATNFASNFSFFSGYYRSVDFDINIVIQKVSFFNGLQWKENQTSLFNARNSFRKLPF
jgi:hypothetical protein